MKCNVSKGRSSDNIIQNDYTTLLNHTYIVSENTIKSLGCETLRVGNNSKYKLCYLFILEIGNLSICSPLSHKDLSEYGKTLADFENEYIPKFYNCDDIGIVYNFIGN